MLKRTMRPEIGALSLLVLCLTITGTADAQGYEGVETCATYHLLTKARNTVRIGVDDAVELAPHRLHQERMRFERYDDFLGADLFELTPEIRARFGLPEDAGVMVVQVAPDSPAAQAGLQARDALTRIDGKEVDSPEAALRALRRAAGEPLAIELWRDGEVVTLTVTADAGVGP